MLRAAGHVAHVQGHETFGTGTHDVDWLPEVGAKGWVLITKDKNIRKRRIELQALRQAGVRTFVLTASNLSGEEQARVLKEALPAMLRMLRRRSFHFVARITSEASVGLIELAKYIVEEPKDE
jgi:predicted nuclease of predicted toxin-antitoxin system